MWQDMSKLDEYTLLTLLCELPAIKNNQQSQSPAVIPNI